MPAWMPLPKLVSILVGIVLSVGGICIVLGWQLRFAAVLLGSFVIVVTMVVHIPALLIEAGIRYRFQPVDVGHSSTKQSGKRTYACSECVSFSCTTGLAGGVWMLL